MPLSLVILAAGMGSRFGGDKPLATVGPNGQSLFEYSVYDAVKAGFNHVIFVVNDQQDTAEIFSRLKKYGSKLTIEFVVQSLTAYVDIVPSQSGVGVATNNNASNPVRTKPWGTAHAVLVCREHIHNPFVVINADDYHGRKNYEKIGRYLLSQCCNSKTCVLPGYRLENTLSSSGSVNRGICEVGDDGFLQSIREVHNILFKQANYAHFDQSDGITSISNDTIVSMTFWGFVPSIFDLLQDQFQLFLNELADAKQAEFYIPDTVNVGINSGMLNAMVFETFEIWKGITYVEDLPMVRNYIAELTESGAYSDIGTY